MWSLPDIHRLNEEASRAAKVNFKKTEKQLCRGQACDCGQKAVHALPYYDVFSDDVKGYVYQCEKCYQNGYPEGYFYCDRCGRDFIENYTWENYFHDDSETCERLCLNCYFDAEVEEESNWVTDVSQVNWSRVRASKHLIPVEGEHWKKKLLFIGNVELDSMSGAKITGFSSASSVEDGLQELRDLVKRALTWNAMKIVLKGEKEQPKCIIILDGAYQFAVSLGVYIPRWFDGEEVEDHG